MWASRPDPNKGARSAVACFAEGEGKETKAAAPPPPMSHPAPAERKSALERLAEAEIKGAVVAKQPLVVDDTALVDTRRFRPADAMAMARSKASAIPWGAFFVLFLLALDAGAINVICRAGTWDHFTSHVSGNTSRAGMYYSGVDTSHIPAIQYSGRQVVAFGFGAALSGIIISKRRVEMGKSLYGMALMLASVFLVLSWYFIKQEDGRMVAVLCAAVACGLQNGMGLTFCGAVVRTTHMTGVVTDIGNVCGRQLGRRSAGLSITEEEAHAERRSLALLGVLLAGYVVGGTLGSVAVDAVGDDAMLGPALLSLLMGSSYTIYRIAFLNQAVLSVKRVERKSIMGGVYRRTSTGVQRIEWGAK